MIRVMIVEDQKLVRSLLESYIQNEDGYQLAVSIPGAAEAPILCDTEDIDLVLMDVQTEHRENGLAAAKKIREAHPEIKIVVATAVKQTPLANKWLPSICGALGGLLGLAAMYINVPDFPAADPLTALAVGIVSGLAATGADQVIKQIGKGN